MSERICKHTVVTLTYHILDADGTLLEQNDVPVSYVHGGERGNQVLPKIEQALEGASAGDSIRVSVSPEEGFGEHDPSLTFTDELENVPPQFHRLGAQVEMQNEAGEVKSFTVTRIEDGKLTVDGNPPLVGKHLTFTVKVLDVRKASPLEVASGQPQGADTLH